MGADPTDVSRLFGSGTHGFSSWETPKLRPLFFVVVIVFKSVAVGDRARLWLGDLEKTDEG